MSHKCHNYYDATIWKADFLISLSYQNNFPIYDNETLTNRVKPHYSTNHYRIDLWLQLPSLYVGKNYLNASQ